MKWTPPSQDELDVWAQTMREGITSGPSVVKAATRQNEYLREKLFEYHKENGTEPDVSKEFWFCIDIIVAQIALLTGGRFYDDGGVCPIEVTNQFFDDVLFPMIRSAAVGARECLIAAVAAGKAEDSAVSHAAEFPDGEVAASLSKPVRH